MHSRGQCVAGLKKMVKEKKCNQCKTTNKQKKWGYSTKWMPDGWDEQILVASVAHVPFTDHCPNFSFSPLFVNPIMSSLGVGFVYAFIFPFLLIHCYFIACLVSSTSSVSSSLICLLSRSAFIVPLVPHKTCTKTILLLQMITEISRILNNSFLSDRPDKKNRFQTLDFHQEGGIDERTITTIST